MGFLNAIWSIAGFFVGISVGLVAGYFVFIYFKRSDVKDPEIKPLIEPDSETMQRMLSEMPLWVKNPDYDRMDWLNQFIDYLWPYIDKAIAKTVRSVVEPIIAEEIPKYKIHSVEFQELTLGSLSPTLQGMKVYEMHDKQLMLEPAIKWAGNPNIMVAIKAFGLKATVQVVDLQVFAVPRIILKPLVPSLPCFANISVSLMEKPHIDFGLKLMGIDLMSIPGLYRFVQRRGQVVVELKYKPFKEEEISKGFEETHAVPKAPEGTPAGSGLLVVIVHEAEDVEGKHHTNPSVRIYFRGDKRKTKRVKKNRDPRWEQEFHFMVDEPPTNDKLHIEVVSTSSKIGLLHPKECLGYVDISLSDVVANKRINEKYHLIDSKNGRIQVELQWRISS